MSSLAYLGGAETGTKPKTGPSVSNMSEGRAKELPSFWIPNETPDNKETLITKPVGEHCVTRNIPTVMYL